VAGLDGGALLDLLAHCLSLGVNAVRNPMDRKPGAWAHAEVLAQAGELDMTRTWTPTVTSYLGRVTKPRILDAVREAAGEEAAERIAGLKKTEMAEAAESLIAGTGWLPPLLRTAQVEAAPEAVAMAAE
jgi:ParB family chromosome partitioning protein